MSENAAPFDDGQNLDSIHPRSFEILFGDSLFSQLPRETRKDEVELKCIRSLYSPAFLNRHSHLVSQPHLVQESRFTISPTQSLT